jgi:hypothetical protein
MRLYCFVCSRCVSNEVADTTVLRAVTICPECLDGGDRDALERWLKSVNAHARPLEERKART